MYDRRVIRGNTYALPTGQVVSSLSGVLITSAVVTNTESRRS